MALATARTSRRASVLDVLFGDGPPADTTYAFVNVTRSFLVDDRPLPAHADRLVLEVVESVAADDDVLAGLQRLRSRGYRIAIDDFVGDADQVAMMPYADFVKIDCRDMHLQGDALVQLGASARRHARRRAGVRRGPRRGVPHLGVRPPAGRRARARRSPWAPRAAGHRQVQTVSCRRHRRRAGRPARRRTAGRGPRP